MATLSQARATLLSLQLCASVSLWFTAVGARYPGSLRLWIRKRLEVEMPDQCEKYQREARIIRPNEHALTEAGRQYGRNATHARGEDCPIILRVPLRRGCAQYGGS